MGEFFKEESYRDIDLYGLSAEQRDEFLKALEGAMDDCHEEITENEDITAAPRRQRRLQRTLYRVRSKGKFFRRAGSDGPSSGISLEESSVASKYRRTILNRFQQSEWSVPEYRMDYYYDFEEWRASGRQAVRFNYWPLSGQISIQGKTWLFGELGLNAHEPIEVVIGLLNSLSGDEAVKAGL